MIRALLRRIIGSRYAHGGALGPPSSEAIWAEINHYEDADLDPDDPIVRLVREARAAGVTNVPLIYGDAELCSGCWRTTELPVYAYITDPVDAFQIATHCPNCPPEEDDE